MALTWSFYAGCVDLDSGAGRNFFSKVAGGRPRSRPSGQCHEKGETVANSAHRSVLVMLANVCGFIAQSADDLETELAAVNDNATGQAPGSTLAQLSAGKGAGPAGQNPAAAPPGLAQIPLKK
jgi:hypothetical protein